MKKIVIMIGLFLGIKGTMAQNISLIAVYDFERKVNVNFEGDEMNEAQAKAMQEMLSKQFQKTFVLECNAYESIYYEKKMLDNQTGSGVNIVMIGESSGKLYKNIREKHYTRLDESLGKRFLIEDPLEDTEWILTDSTKEIQGYLCYKAKSIRELTVNDSIIRIPVQAWYAPDIPVSNGPELHWGLPGFIMQVSEGDVTITCKSLLIQTQKNKEIEKPKGGKKLNAAKYREIVRKKMEQQQKMQENNWQQDENAVEIKIGG